MKYYIVEKLENMNMIFSTGVISCNCIIKKRKFGNKFYKENEYNLFEDSLTLYKKKPVYNNDILIEIALEDNFELIKLNDLIYAYNGSIILNSEKVKMFANEIVIEKLINKANVSREIKVSNIVNFLKKSNFENGENIDFDGIRKLDKQDNVLIENYLYIEEVLDRIRGGIALQYYLNKVELFEGNTIEVISSFENLEKVASKNAKKFSDSSKFYEFIKESALLNEMYSSRDMIKFKNIKLEKDEVKLINEILKSLIENSVDLKNYEISKNVIYKILQDLKKMRVSLNDLELMHKKFINNIEINTNIEDLESDLLKSLYVIFLKGININETIKYIEKKKIKYKDLVLMFLGVFIGYSEITKSISNMGDSKYVNKFIEEQVDELKKNQYLYISNKYLFEILYLSNKLGKEKLLNLLKIDTIKNNIEGIRMYTRSDKAVEVIINDKFIITYYVKKYSGLYNKFKISMHSNNVMYNNKNNKYKYFKISKINNKKMSINDEMELYKSLRKIIGRRKKYELV